MDLIAADLVSNDACGQDIQAQNPIAMQVLTGLQNYLLYYGASCLKDPVTNIYCTLPRSVNKVDKQVTPWPLQTPPIPPTQQCTISLRCPFSRAQDRVVRPAFKICSTSTSHSRQMRRSK